MALPGEPIACERLPVLSLESIRAEQDLQLRYTETRYSTLLAKPAESSGLLEYRHHDGSMIKQEQQPRQRQFILSGKQAEVHARGKVRTIKLPQGHTLGWLHTLMAAVARRDPGLLAGIQNVSCYQSSEGWAIRLYQETAQPGADSRRPSKQGTKTEQLILSGRQLTLLALERQVNKRTTSSMRFAAAESP